MSPISAARVCTAICCSPGATPCSYAMPLTKVTKSLTIWKGESCAGRRPRMRTTCRIRAILLIVRIIRPWGGPVPMILCVCNALRETDVRAAASPKGCPVETYARLGARPQCGQCLPHARRVLKAGRA